MRLFLCEKPSQGKDIGRVLGATQRGNGCLTGSGVTVTWCIGHLVEAAAPEAYDVALKRWAMEQLPIIPERWRVEVKAKTAAQFKIVKALLAKTTHLVIATDADREGELIAREMIDLCSYRGSIDRLWLSMLSTHVKDSVNTRFYPAVGGGMRAKEGKILSADRFPNIWEQGQQIHPIARASRPGRSLPRRRHYACSVAQH